VIDNWRKATYSANNATCVETGWSDDVVGYRDTKQGRLPAQPTLLFTTQAAHRFVRMLKS
jgi:uncharacterized protein DUF397